ncbi:MAG: Mrp/NBP35 family ATP-binding protein [Lachnospiraceae bacterium]|nr:Mrp/NBP35 family ATP-binding protein [Lachnospiraceae bacterium]
MSECSGTCASCASNCKDRKEANQFLIEQNEFSNVKKIIGIVSGKGGVGKSLVTSMLASMMNKRGYKTAILDADITGPSIPKAFGIKGRAMATKEGIIPSESANGVSVMSINLLVDNETDPVVWRGPVIANMVKQFYSEVNWGDIDYMFADMPPGTGDVPLTVFQSIPVDGIVVVSSPQELVSMIVAKAVNMANMMNIPIIGLVENMSYLECPDCGKKLEVFGKSKVEEVAADFALNTFTRLPIAPSIASACDAGKIETIDIDALNVILDKIEKG